MSETGGEAGLRVTVAQGALRGRMDGGVVAFLGVPYAAAPFGVHRMRPPQPCPRWVGVHEATSYGPTCPKAGYPPQYAPLFPEVEIPGAECLNLNVWTPDPAAAGLPVLVWVHGGAFTNGSGSVAEYRGGGFARDGVVCVTINYRLAAEGFLYFGDGRDNLGLLDQIAALEWVQENIHAFGGDPRRVTVAGESAGAMSVITLLSLPRSAGLFAQAIAQSGAAAHTMTPEYGRRVAASLAESLGVPHDREAIAALPVERVVQAAAALSAEMEAAPDPGKWGALALSLLLFMPTEDGAVIPGRPLESLASGQGSTVPLLIGTTMEEFRVFTVADGSIDMIDASMLEQAAAGYGAPEQAIATYRRNRPDASEGDLLSAMVTDWFFRIPAIRVAEARSKTLAQTWMYRFDYRSPSFDGRLGACHGIELPFVFDTLDEPSTFARIGKNAPQPVADTAHGAWVRFITEAEPGWNRYDESARETALLSETLETCEDPGGDERALWAGRR